MSEYMKAWSSVLFMAVQVLLLIGIIVATMDVCAAERYHGSVIAEIENSDFNEDVIEICKTEAGKQGYQLTVAKIILDQRTNRQIAEVELAYQFRIGILNMDHSHKISGTAG